MSQQVPKESIASTHIVEALENLSFKIDLIVLTTETKKSETKVVSLGLPKNESLKDFDKRMEQVAEDSLDHWND